MTNDKQTHLVHVVVCRGWSARARRLAGMVSICIWVNGISTSDVYTYRVFVCCNYVRSYAYSVYHIYPNVPTVTCGLALDAKPSHSVHTHSA